MLNPQELPGSAHSLCVGSPPNGAALSTDTLKPLMRRIAAGNDDALADLYNSTVKRLNALSRAVLRCPQDAEEIVGDVFIYVWSHADRYDECRGSVMAWLAIITRHRSIDRYRARSRSVPFDEWEGNLLSRGRGEWETPDRRVAQWQQAHSLYGALALLAPLRRQLLSLAFLHGFAHEEIADIVDLPLGTVKSHIRRALRSLRSGLEES